MAEAALAAGDRPTGLETARMGLDLAPVTGDRAAVPELRRIVVAARDDPDGAVDELVGAAAEASRCGSWLWALRIGVDLARLDPAPGRQVLVEALDHVTGGEDLELIRRAREVVGVG
jgi:hypothetical protein